MEEGEKSHFWLELVFQQNSSQLEVPNKQYESCLYWTRKYKISYNFLTEFVKEQIINFSYNHNRSRRLTFESVDLLLELLHRSLSKLSASLSLDYSEEKSSNFGRKYFEELKEMTWSKPSVDPFYWLRSLSFIVVLGLCKDASPPYAWKPRF